MHSLESKQIVAIDDAKAIRVFLRICLQAHGAGFHEAATAGDGVRMCASVRPDVVVLDLGLPDRDGLDILPEIKSNFAPSGDRPRVVILSVRKEAEVREKAFLLGADAYVTKPFLMEELIAALEGGSGGRH